VRLAYAFVLLPWKCDNRALTAEGRAAHADRENVALQDSGGTNTVLQKTSVATAGAA
jgi:hypothetical protein